MLDQLALQTSFVLAFFSFYIIAFLIFTEYRWLIVPYILWQFFDRNAKEQGGRAASWMRESSIWNCYARYFPIKLIKTVNLDPLKNYLICVHPHGLVPYGICTNFGTEATGFKQLFPGLTPHLLTLNMCFYVPIVREILLLLGCGVASAKSIKFILSNKGKCKMMGQAPVLVVGGLAEFRENDPHHIRLVLKKRFGFVKLALQTGACLVPVFSFGENETYNAELNELTREFNIYFKMERLICRNFLKIDFWSKILRECILCLKYNVVMLFSMPKSLPINAVVGKPIEIGEKVENPSEKQINELHETYINELTKLFYEHKDKYLNNKNSSFEII